MSLDEKTVKTVVAILPTAISLVGQIVTFAKQAKADGIEIPSIDSLKELSQQLKDLEDL